MFNMYAELSVNFSHEIFSRIKARRQCAGLKMRSETLSMSLGTRVEPPQPDSRRVGDAAPDEPA